VQQFVIPHDALVAAGPSEAVMHTAVLTGEDFHYLAHVRRLGPGDTIPASTPDGSRFAMTVRERGRDRLSVTLRPIGDGAAPPALPMTVAQAVVKPAAMDLIVRQATELGVRRIVPVLTERSMPASHAHPRLPRWQRIGRSASQQSGRSPLPAIEAPRSLPEVLRAATSVAGKLVFQPPEPAEADVDLPDTLDPAEPVWLLLGPEGGFSAAELDRIADAGFRRCALGATVLRAETAVVAAITAVRVLWHRAPPPDHDAGRAER
jgi:16S rRNA (uracil1498-N3)-methyltransferase